VPPPLRKGEQKLISDLGHKIQVERVRLGLTQMKLAELSSMSTRVIQKIEAGDISIKAVTLIRLQRILKCPWARLLPDQWA
jgi:transcriptional regulator with XRE-family HTH domain